MRRTLCENSNVMILHWETGLQLLSNTVDYWPLTRLQFGVDDYRSGGNGFAKKNEDNFSIFIFTMLALGELYVAISFYWYVPYSNSIFKLHSYSIYVM